MDIEMIKGIPGPDHLKVLIQHEEKLAGVRRGGSINIHGSQIPTEGGNVSIRQAQDVVVKAVNNPLTFCRQLGVHGVNVRFAQWVSGEIDLPKHVEAQLPMTIAP